MRCGRGRFRAAAALAYKIISRYQQEKHLLMDEAPLQAMIGAVEPSFCRLLMSNWRLTADVQDAASGWTEYPKGVKSDLAGVVAAAHLLAVHMLQPLDVLAEAVLASTLFEALAMSAEDLATLLAERDTLLRRADFLGRAILTNFGSCCPQIRCT